MEIKERLENFELFKKLYEKENPNIRFDEFEKFFFVKSYFLSKETPFIEEIFYETLFELVGNMLKGQLSELEYYVNVKHSTPLANSDIEVLNKENENLMKYYFKMHVAYKKLHRILLRHEANTPIPIEFLNGNFELFKDLNKYFIEIQEKLIKNLNKKLAETEKKKDEKFHSSIFH